MTEKQEAQIAGFLGLCMRAGQLVSGQEACVELIRAGKAAVALMDTAAGANTQKRLRDACQSHETPLYGLSPGTLGNAIGHGGRMVAALGAGGMAQKLLHSLKEEPRL